MTRAAILEAKGRMTACVLGLLAAFGGSECTRATIPRGLIRHWDLRAAPGVPADLRTQSIRSPAVRHFQDQIPYGPRHVPMLVQWTAIHTKTGDDLLTFDAYLLKPAPYDPPVAAEVEVLYVPDEWNDPPEVARFHAGWKSGASSGVDVLLFAADGKTSQADSSRLGR